MGGNDGWGQTWSHTSFGKCERHRTLVVIHWLTINAKKGFFNPIWQIPEKGPLGMMGGGKGWGKLQIALTCVCMQYLGHMQDLNNLP